MVKLRVLMLLLTVAWAGTGQAANWEPQSVAAFGPNFYARGVWFTDSQNGWIAGSDLVDEPSIYEQRIWATTDGGANWTSQVSDPGAIDSIHFLNSSIGFATGTHGGQQIKRTTDGGANWTTTTFVGGGSSLYDVAAPDALNVWAVGDNTFVRHSTDGGVNWGTQAVAGIASTQISRIEMLDALTGYIATGTNGQIFKTTDGGSNWSEVYTLASTFGFAEMQFTDENTGYAAGPESVLIRTTDGGLNWTNLGLPVSGTASAMHFISASEGWLITEGAHNSIYHTTDSGDNWELQYQTANNILLGDINFSDAETGWVVGENGAFAPSLQIFGMRSLSLNGSFPSVVLQFDPNAPGIGSVPEPCSLLLLSLGLPALRRKRTP